MSQLTIPYSRTFFGFKLLQHQLAPDRAMRPSSQPRDELSLPRTGLRELQPDQREEILRQLAPLGSAIAALKRQRDAIEDLRVSLRATGSSTVSGLWSRAVRWLDWGTWRSATSHLRRAVAIEQSITDGLTEIKRINERIVVPAIATVREEFQGRTFIRNSATPEALLLVAVPSEKVGKLISFDSLKLTIDSRTAGGLILCDTSRGEGRIVLERTHAGVREQVELAYKRPGKIDLYINGERRGSMWNDDALAFVDAFLSGRSTPLEKRKRSEHYTIGG
ncbi:MAG: hypothetical protein ACK5GN_09575 [Pseudomonadota bacterium]|jgi:hypothetical protein